MGAERNVNNDVVLAQWQTCVEMANCISERRDNMNNIFITLNLGIITAISFTWSKKTLLLTISGIVVCAIWLIFIRNFKLLNSAKFQVINNIENLLPVKPFNDEWKLLKSNKKYSDGTKLEKLFPLFFIVLYIIVIIIVYQK